MNLTRPSEVRALLAELGCRPRKAWGQNFLVDANILRILLETADVQPADEVLEVGAGLGVLTAPLARRARRVTAVEIDPRLCAWLREQLGGRPNLELIAGDILRLDLEALLAAGISQVVANLPYATGSAILVNILRASAPPRRLTLTLQLEVARRLAAAPGGRDFGLLSLWSQLLYEVSVRKIVSPTCFFPAPRVHSAIVRLDRRAGPPPDPARRAFFFTLTKFAFGRRRKQLGPLLADAPAAGRVTAARVRDVFRELRLDPRGRPETLGAGDWLRLAGALQP